MITMNKLYIILQADDEQVFHGVLLGPADRDINALAREFKSEMYSAIGGALVYKRLGDGYMNPERWEVANILNHEQVETAIEVGFPLHLRGDGTYTVNPYGKEWVERFFRWLVEERGFERPSGPTSLWLVRVTGF